MCRIITFRLVDMTGKIMLMVMIIMTMREKSRRKRRWRTRRKRPRDGRISACMENRRETKRKSGESMLWCGSINE